jgi:hypothetical protein
VRGGYVGWDGIGWGSMLVVFCSLCGCGRPKKIQYTPNDALSLFLVLDRFSRPVYVWGDVFAHTRYVGLYILSVGASVGTCSASS